MSMPTKVLCLLVLFIFGCATKLQKPESSLQNYISLNLDYKPYEEMRFNLEKSLKLKTPLKNRGEAHITVITPPEFAILITKISADAIHKKADLFFKNRPHFKQICTGEGTKEISGQIQKTYYVVIESYDLLEFRQDLAKMGNFNLEEFNPNIFYPHITLGFTDRDLHYEDGVIKDKKSCLPN